MAYGTAPSSSLTVALQEYLTGVRILRLFGRSPKAVEWVDTLSEELRQANLSEMRLRLGLQPVYASPRIPVLGRTEEIFTLALAYLGAMVASDRRRILGTVPQTGWMFSGSVADNLTLWDDTISRDAVEKAGRTSGADTFIMRLASGYDTVITIAHRISTAMEANRIVVMEDGMIVEEGTPEDLIRNGGPFAALWVLENAGWDRREKQKG